MKLSYRSKWLTAAIFLTLPALVPLGAWAQTPEQMEYDRQQREYRQQLERQQQEQQRQQQIMNENAQRQQEESRRFNAPTGQSPSPGYQGGYTQPQGGGAPSRRGPPSIDATASTAGATWVNTCSNPKIGLDIYIAKNTIQRSGNQIRMWDMLSFKTAQVADNIRYLSAKNQHEIDCKAGRMRMVSTTGFSGPMGKGAVVIADQTQFPWQSVAHGDFAYGCFIKAACEK